MVDRFSYIMEKSGSLGHPYIDSDLTRKQSCQLGNFNRMLQCILSVTCTELHASEETDQFRMNARYADSRIMASTSF